MKFTAKAEYGLRAILEIAMKGGEPAKVNEIARNQNMPERFLEQAMASLKKAKLIESIRGAYGGYVLADKPENITLGKVIAALEGPMALADCLKTGGSVPAGHAYRQAGRQGCGQELCTIKNVWRKVQSAILESLDSITIKQLIEEEELKKEVGGVSC